MERWFFPILYVTTASAGLPVVAGVAYFRRARIDIRLLTLLFALVFAIDCYSLYCAWMHYSANWIYHFHSPLEYAIFGIVISTWQTGRFERRAILLSIALFALLSAWDIFGIGDWEHTNNFTASVACALFVGMSSYTLVNIERSQAGRLLTNYRFWMLIGLLIYAAGNLAYFAFFRHFVSYYLWAGHNLLNILANICFAVGILCQARWD